MRWAYRDDDWATYARHVHAMETLARTGDQIGPREKVLLATRQFPLYGHAGDIDALSSAYHAALADIPTPSS